MSVALMEFEIFSDELEMTELGRSQKAELREFAVVLGSRALM